MSTPNDSNRFTYLTIRDLAQLADELQKLRSYPALFSTGGGQYSGYILAFVKGLRISARLIYFIRKCLSTKNCEVSWGHILDQEGQACSPECDVIIHSPGHLDKWNDSKEPIMEFVFVEARYVQAVVSCKSRLADIDYEYPKQMAKFGINKIFLFAESCSLTNYNTLAERAIEAGYVGLWCAYFTEGDADEFTTSDEHYTDFRDKLLSLFTA